MLAEKLTKGENIFKDVQAEFRERMNETKQKLVGEKVLKEEDVTEMELTKKKIDPQIFKFHMLFERRGFVGDTKEVSKEGKKVDDKGLK